MQGQFRNLKEKFVSSRQESAELRDEVQSLTRVKDRVRSLELQLKVDSRVICVSPLLYAALIT